MKKGFTLIEMIGVMVILSLLMTFAMPSIINYIKKGGETKDIVVKEMIYDAAKNYISDNKNMFKKDEKNTYCISLYTLASEGYIESPITLSSSDDDITRESSTKTVEVTYDKKYKYELVDECTGIINPTPILFKGLTPVYYDGTNSNWVVANPKTDDWYDYENQKWANSVVLASGVTKNPGDTVAVDGTEAVMMYVWIPRYEYKYTNLGTDYAGGTLEQPGAIEINFISKGAATSSSREYKVHPAFDFGGQQLSGLWVGKFEISHSDSAKSTTSLGCTTTDCLEAVNLRILPNVSSLRSNSVSSFWYGIKSIENQTTTFGLINVDIHMIKNSEWGAVTYLSQSKYGKYGNIGYEDEYKEVYQNKSDTFITGSSNGTPSQSESRSDEQCAYDDMLNLGTKKGQCGPGASTTGNIYGIYDMSGGAWEYVMGTYIDYDNTTSDTSGFVALPNSKYFNEYFTSSVETECRNGEVSEPCYGHGSSETSGWYGDTLAMPYIEKSWTLRGGNYNHGSAAGIFYFGYNSGAKSSNDSTRVTLVEK